MGFTMVLAMRQIEAAAVQMADVAIHATKNSTNFRPHLEWATAVFYSRQAFSTARCVIVITVSGSLGEEGRECLAQFLRCDPVTLVARGRVRCVFHLDERPRRIGPNAEPHRKLERVWISGYRVAEAALEYLAADTRYPDIQTRTGFQ